MTLTERTQQIYAAFSRGDIPYILDQLAEDVAWEDWGQLNSAQRAGVPWLQPRRGRAGAAEFFATLAPLQFLEFSVLSIMEGPGQVAAEIRLRFGNPAGDPILEQEIHLITFNDAGQITRFRHYGDFASHIALAQAIAGTSA